jgi:hypothetical protein
MAKTEKTIRDPALRAAVKAVALSGVALALGALVGFGTRNAMGVGLGAAIATANLYVFVKLSEAFMERRGTAPWIAVGIIKMTALLFVVWLVIKNGTVPPFALAVGYGALPLGITLGSLFGPKLPDPIDDDPEPPADVVEGGPDGQPPFPDEVRAPKERNDD